MGIKGRPTPKNIDEAITDAFCVGPVSEIRDHARAVIKDYLAQKFAAAVMANCEDSKTEKVLMDLFEEIVKKEGV